ncbi:MAG: zinc-binding dehydrogenase [Spirochaetaceae bacterium]|nr:MAG: zinc-binding dehydrogenase [Spirochaetaceae bacterium]
MSDVVKAAVLIEPGKIEIREYPRPKLEEGALLVRPLMSGICGTDKHGYQGDAVQYAGTPREIYGPYPAVPGHENVAVIEEVKSSRGGKAVDFYGNELNHGDRIVISPDIMCGTCYWCRHSFGYTWCDNIRSYGHLDCSVPPHLIGGWAELMYVFPGSHIFKISDDVSDQIAVLAEPMAVAYSLDIAKGFSSLPHEGFSSGDCVVVFGVGPLGLCHLLKARLLGAGTIIAVDRSEFRLNFVKSYGADVTIDVDKTSAQERRDMVLGLTAGRGADVVIECAGAAEVLPEGIELLRQGGTFIEVGHFVDVGDIQINPHRHLCAKNIRLIGQMNLAYTGIIPSIDLMMKNRDRFDFDSIVTHRYHFRDSLEGLIQSMRPNSMKVVIHP